MKHTNLNMIAPIFIRSETLSLKRNSKKTASVIFGKNVACNYCIEKTSRVCNYCIIPEKNVACNSDEKNGECNFEGKKTTSVMVKKTASVYSHGPSRPSYKGPSYNIIGYPKHCQNRSP